MAVSLKIWRGDETQILYRMRASYADGLKIQRYEYHSVNCAVRLKIQRGDEYIIQNENKLWQLA